MIRADERSAREGGILSGVDLGLSLLIDKGIHWTNFCLEQN